MCSGDGRKWQHTPVFLPVKPHGQRSLAGYSPQGYKESDTTHQAHMHDGLNLRDRVLGEVERASLLFHANGATVGKGPQNYVSHPGGDSEQSYCVQRTGCELVMDMLFVG